MKFNVKGQLIQTTPKFETIDTYIVFGLCIVSFWTHLWIIQHPAHVTFDEVHFGNFTNWYTQSRFFFDIHPPLGKLIMFLMANLSEYDGNIHFENDTGSAYSEGTYVPLRITPAFFSSMCSPLLYLAMRFSSFSKCASFAAASLVCFDTSLLCEGRFILSDGLLHFFTCLHILIFCYGFSIPRDTFEFRLWQFLSGLSLGAACSCKNTAWGLCALNGLYHIMELYCQHNSITPQFVSELIIRGLTLGLTAISVYFISFIIHFALLPYTGQGTGYLNEEMKKQLVDTNLIGHQIWGVRVSGHSLIWRSVMLSVIMHTGNMHITQFHPYQSRPIAWPLLNDIRVAFFLNGNQEVACMGNVFSYYLAFFGVWAVLFGKNHKKWLISLRFTIGWAVSYFPFFLIPRSMYLYHYLIPLMFGCLSFGACIDLYLPKFLRGFVSVITCFLAFSGFFLWSSYCYGTPAYDKRVTIWNQNWIHGDSVHQRLSRESGNSKGQIDTKGVLVI
ncbi:Dolichyl-phosphate-mannose-protein mannosyltransferase [Tritrichomonas foetus]|uniref:Dolichyl-phosphate-mannose-protein mannosyltransferase n=1 Tax=Tritrichomonas foetus TaxID=1144522 RepID=A0A1J4KCL7_9EUKA|nr:Dolichyl-phosphate-mannose-protein mannosyltransferase [Tritrichomonas foetus]|eukprot:OHT08680.1 Dolichyl-phosphate-mannose-protein mannosyltransferase [Tritrichomonas foetus]